MFRKLLIRIIDSLISKYEFRRRRFSNERDRYLELSKEYPEAYKIDIEMYECLLKDVVNVIGVLIEVKHDVNRRII